MIDFSHFKIAAPAIVSFSGGRTSAYMVCCIMDAYLSDLPKGVHIVFANTGKEREETLKFVRDLDEWRGARVRWVEWRDTPEGFVEVDFASASRNGEPFDALIAKKKFLPNSAARFCTQELKVKPIHAFARSIGLENYTEIIGLRADEPWRVAKMIGRNADESRQCIAPLARAGVDRREIMLWWQESAWDLDLLPGEGNCDLCFLKGAGLLRSLMKADPSSADWWIGHEKAIGAQFTKRDSYAQMRRDALANGELPFEPDEHDAECGLHCTPIEDAA